MKLVKLVGPQCPCHVKLIGFQQEAAGQGRVFAVGTEVRCDCGRLYRLRDEQRDGLYWQQMESV